MSGESEGSTVSDGLRDELAAELAYWYPDSGTGQAHTDDEHREAADALLPVVRRYAARELRDAAERLREPGGWLTGRILDAHEALNRRADALEAGE